MSCSDPARFSGGADALYQPFPRRGRLAEGLNQTFSRLRARVGRELAKRPVYSYVVTTATVEDKEFRQTGSAPNFQGGRVTLCTCKHKDRASPPPVHCRGPVSDGPWRGIWVAGLCSSTQFRPRALFYLMLVSRTYGSHAAAWQSLGSPLAKSAHRNRYGDIYEPVGLPCRQPWRASSYRSHLPGHVHDEGGREYDIERTFHGRHPHLLEGDRRHSYLWSQPTITLRPDADVEWSSAHHRFFPRLADLLAICR